MISSALRLKGRLSSVPSALVFHILLACLKDIVALA